MNLLPDGRYAVRVCEVRAISAGKAWLLSYAITRGESKNEMIPDRVEFNESGEPDKGELFRAIGVGVNTETRYHPQAILGAKLGVDVDVEKIVGTDGKELVLNVVTGYAPDSGGPTG